MNFLINIYIVYHCIYVVYIHGDRSTGPCKEL